jgi:hypothetical protein
MNRREAIRQAKAHGAARAVLLNGECLVLPYDEVDRLELSGVEFALLSEHAGLVMTVPVND